LILIKKGGFGTKATFIPAIQRHQKGGFGTKTLLFYP